MLTTTITITAACKVLLLPSKPCREFFLNWPEPIYLYACWLCFLFAFFRIKDSADFNGFENVI